jgi:hypothetical protein
MSEEPIRFDPNTWAGELPGPRKPKQPPPTARLFTGLAMVAFALVWYSNELFTGFWRGAMLVPFRRGHTHYVTLSDGSAFWWSAFGNLLEGLCLLFGHLGDV